MACAILERTSGFETSSETIAPRYLKLFTVLSFCLPLGAVSAVCHQCGLLSTDLHLIQCSGMGTVKYVKASPQ